MRKCISIVILLSMLFGCATTKKIICPIAAFLKPIHIEVGMNPDDVIREFTRKPNKTILYVDNDGFTSIEIWVYTMGQGLSAAKDRHSKQLGGYDWYVYFANNEVIGHKCYEYGR